jgi:hypothetical protein
MLAGFNHNVKHKGKLYHVQTEDSGVGNPHVITHLFVGGNILASKRTSYADIVGAGNLPVVVRDIMEEQHKEMLRNLVNGIYDEVSSAQARAYQPGQIAAPDAPAPPLRSAPPRSGRTEVKAPAPPAQRSSPAAPAARRAPPPPMSSMSPALTPPPLLRRTGPTVSRAAPAIPSAPVARPPAPPPLRPAPAARAASLETPFGEDLFDERSLDKVILSYLAEELGGRK